MSALDLLENNSDNGDNGDNGGPSADHNSDQFEPSLHELLGRNASLEALLLDNCDALEQSFAELGQLEDDFDAFQIYSMVNTFKSRLRAKTKPLRQKSIDENNEACDDDVDVVGQGMLTANSAKSRGGPLKVVNESESFDDYGSDSSESTDEISYSQRDRLDSKIKEREAVEERLKRKMDGSDNAFPSSKNEVKEQLGRKMKESAKPSSIPPKTQESFEERLKKKMIDSDTSTVGRNNGTSNNDKLDRKIKAREAKEERLRKKMAESESDAPIEAAGKLTTAKVSFEERLKNKMTGSEFTKSIPKDRVKNKMTESHSTKSIPKDVTSSVKSPKTNSKESSEERLKMKMAGESDTTTKVSGPIKRISEFDSNESNEDEIMPSSDHRRDKLERKIRERKALEERMKRNMAGSDNVVVPSCKNAVEERVKRKMKESVTKSSLLPPIASQTSTEKESFEERLKKKMSDPDTVVRRGSDNGDKLDKKIKARKATEERLRKKMAGSHVPAHNDERVQSKMTECESTAPIPGSFEDRLKKKMSDPDTVARRGSDNGDKLDKKIKARKATEERLRKKMAGSHATMDAQNDERVQNKMTECESTAPIPGSFEERLKKKMSDPDTVARRGSSNEDKLDKKIKSREATEERLRKKMAGSHATMDAQNDERVKSKMKESAEVSPLPPVASRKPAANESFEDRLKKKTTKSDTTSVPSSSYVPPKSSPCPQDRSAQFMMRSVSDSEVSESTGEISCSQRDRLDRKIKAREADERLKQKMAGSDNVVVPSSKKAIEERTKRKMKKSAKHHSK